MPTRRRVTRGRVGPAPMLALLALGAGSLLVLPVAHLASLNGLPPNTGLGRSTVAFPTYTYGTATGVTTITFTVTSSSGVQPSAGNVRAKYALDAGWTFCTRNTGTTTWTCPRALSVSSGALLRTAAP